MEERNAERQAFSPRRLKALITAVRGYYRAAEKLSCLRCRDDPPASDGAPLCPIFTNRKQWQYYINSGRMCQEFRCKMGAAATASRGARIIPVRPQKR